MLKHLMIAVDWYGPYLSVGDAQRAARDWDWPGLYMCVGKTGSQKASQLQYVGIAKSLGTRVSDRHETIGAGSGIQDVRVWLGEVATAEPSGKRMKVTKATIDYAEWLHARFLRLPLNKKKTKRVPPRSVTVLNRWWNTDFDNMRLRKNRPHPDWPNLIDFPDYEGAAARAVWFGGKQRTFAWPEYKA